MGYAYGGSLASGLASGFAQGWELGEKMNEAMRRKHYNEAIEAAGKERDEALAALPSQEEIDTQNTKARNAAVITPAMAEFGVKEGDDMKLHGTDPHYRASDLKEDFPASYFVPAGRKRVSDGANFGGHVKYETQGSRERQRKDIELKYERAVHNAQQKRYGGVSLEHDKLLADKAKELNFRQSISDGYKQFLGGDRKMLGAVVAAIPPSRLQQFLPSGSSLQPMKDGTYAVVDNNTGRVLTDEGGNPLDSMHMTRAMADQAFSSWAFMAKLANDGDYKSLYEMYGDDLDNRLKLAKITYYENKGAGTTGTSSSGGAAGGVPGNGRRVTYEDDPVNGRVATLTGKVNGVAGVELGRYYQDSKHPDVMVPAGEDPQAWFKTAEAVSNKLGPEYSLYKVPHASGRGSVLVVNRKTGAQTTLESAMSENPDWALPSKQAIKLDGFYRDAPNRGRVQSDVALDPSLIRDSNLAAVGLEERARQSSDQQDGVYNEEDGVIPYGGVDTEGNVQAQIAEAERQQAIRDRLSPSLKDPVTGRDPNNTPPMSDEDWQKHSGLLGKLGSPNPDRDRERYSGGATITRKDPIADIVRRTNPRIDPVTGQDYNRRSAMSDEDWKKHSGLLGKLGSPNPDRDRGTGNAPSAEETPVDYIQDIIDRTTPRNDPLQDAIERTTPREGGQPVDPLTEIYEQPLAKGKRETAVTAGKSSSTIKVHEGKAPADRPRRQAVTPPSKQSGMATGRKGAAARNFDEGRKLVRDLEGYERKPFRDAGKWAIGIGHQITEEEVEKYKGGVSDEQIEAWFEQDYTKADKAISKRFPNLTKRQHEAITSLYFNYPAMFKEAPKLCAALDRGDWETAKLEMSDIIYAVNSKTGKRGVDRGLVNRRRVEGKHGDRKDNPDTAVKFGGKHK